MKTLEVVQWTTMRIQSGSSNQTQMLTSIRALLPKLNGRLEAQLVSESNLSIL
jgi:hypothetical protein